MPVSRALYEDYLPVLNDMACFRLEQEFNTLGTLLDMVEDSTDFDAVKVRRWRLAEKGSNVVAHVIC